MKKLIKEFGSSIYNPSFYKQINSRPLRSIFIYMLKVDLVVSVLVLVVTAVYVGFNLSQFGNVPNSTLAVSYIMAVVAVPIAVFLTIFVTWILYGWIFGVIILLVSTIFKNKIPYTISVKTALYAMSSGVLLSIIPNLPFRLLLGIAVPILIVLINRKKS
ncbi:MAG: hypothetical protein V4481_05465 [Patescibacteria group bacterium]